MFVRNLGSRAGLSFMGVALLLIVGCSSMSTIESKPANIGVPIVSEYETLRTNALMAKIRSEISERRVRENWSKLNWIKNEKTESGSYTSPETGDTIMFSRSATLEYFGERTLSSDFFGCGYYFGPNKKLGYIYRICGQSRSGKLDGWFAAQKNGGITLLEYHDGKANGLGLACGCKDKGCNGVVNCQERWYLDGVATSSKQRKFSLPQALSDEIFVQRTDNSKSAGVVSAPSTQDGKPVSVPSDPGATYLALSIEKAPSEGEIYITTQRTGKSGITYAKRLINCRQNTFKYVGDADSLEVLKSQNLKEEMGGLSHGSISWYVSQYACAQIAALN